MLSNHYPLTHSTAFSWVIASLVFLMGVSIRHYFNTRHARAGNPRWTWAVTTALFLAIMALSLAPLAMKNAEDETLELSQLSPVQQQMATHQDF